jgi:two-component system, LytTR family, sensor kinase
MYLFWLGFNQPAIPSIKVNIMFTLVDFVCFVSIAMAASYILIPRFLYKKKYLHFMGSYFLVLFLITSFMVYCNFLILKPFGNAQPGPFKFNLKDLAGSYLLAFFLSSVSSIFKLINDFYSSQSTIIKLREEKLKTELEFLKLQVSPHSFFNILNTIYFQIDLDKESAKKCVLLFSNIFRYQLYECNGDKVLLEKEIDFLNNYVQISKARFDVDYKIEFEVKKSGNPLIAPFLLFPLFENGFKHVSQFINKVNTITLFIEYNDKELKCKVCNTADSMHATGNGIGLKNLNRRLELLYKDRYVFSAKCENGIYQTQLNLSL